MNLRTFIGNGEPTAIPPCTFASTFELAGDCLSAWRWIFLSSSGRFVPTDEAAERLMGNVGNIVCEGGSVPSFFTSLNTPPVAVFTYATAFSGTAIRTIFRAVAAASFSAGSFGEESRSEVCTWTERLTVTSVRLIVCTDDWVRCGLDAPRVDGTGAEVEPREAVAGAGVRDATAVLMAETL
jgi:hypothetical protein